MGVKLEDFFPDIVQFIHNVKKVMQSGAFEDVLTKMMMTKNKKNMVMKAQNRLISFTLTKMFGIDIKLFFICNIAMNERACAFKSQYFS